MHVSGLENVIFGNKFYSGKEYRIIASNHNYDYELKIPYDDTYISKDVFIEDNLSMGERVMIPFGVKMIIQAVYVDCIIVPSLSIAGGYPTIPFNYMNENHYCSLRSWGKFFKT